MKKAVIVVGCHYAGKSKTIKKYFKPLVGLAGNERIFRIGDRDGVVRSQSLEERFGNGHVSSQSLEEKGNTDVVDVVDRHAHFDFLVFAARPENEGGSLYGVLKSELSNRGFSVATVRIVKGQAESFYAECAQEILGHLI